MNKLFVFIYATLLCVLLAYAVSTVFIALCGFVLWDVNVSFGMFNEFTWQGFRITLIFSSIMGAVMTCIVCHEN